MNQRDKDTLLRAAVIIKGLNDRDSQWLNEMEDGLTSLANTADTLERIKKKQNRVAAAGRTGEPPAQLTICQHSYTSTDANTHRRYCIACCQEV